MGGSGNLSLCRNRTHFNLLPTFYSSSEKKKRKGKREQKSCSIAQAGMQSKNRWQKIFSFNVWGKIATLWNKAFLTIIILLIVLFLDAVREVRKYSSVHTIEKSSTSRPDAYEHTQMKLFRSQRNLYISGFSLFFWLVLRRLVTLITQLAKELSNKGVLKTQAENTSKAAKKFLEENEKLKRILKSRGNNEECVLEAENKKLVEDQEKLKTELRKTSDAPTLKDFQM
uniref:B-cell receptor-associated protein 29 isoform X3 n=1 Tax=Callithrix jacchus TaxID=9483 RepID=UPI0023DD5573|nr:B-cell receptor-associated protein 29 isoform X3 [Callithrix jacchus]